MSYSQGAIEPSTGGAGFYSDVFVIPKDIGGLSLILSLKQYNCYMHIPTFKIPTKHSNLFKNVIMSFLLIPRVFICIVLLLKTIIIFAFCLQNKPYQHIFLPFGLTSAPRAFVFIQYFGLDWFKAWLQEGTLFL